MPGKIFINYRRDDDAGSTGRLRDQLEDVFASDRLFMDVDSIEPGLDFVRVLEDQVNNCDVILAVIGPRWLDARDKEGNRRLDDPNDFVRIEIESSLKLGKRIIPVLVNNADMPRAEHLPETLRPFLRRNAVRITHQRFKADAQGLIKALEKALEEVEADRAAQTAAAPTGARRRRRSSSFGRIFISHSSHNNDQAIQLRDWLVENGWDDVFLDLDPEHGIAAGERWKEALQKAAQRCELVLALISPEWLASPWLRPELNTAQLLGKKIFVLLIGSKPSDVPGDLEDVQYVDLINDPDAYIRLKEGLKRAGLDPASFPFAEGRRPYPGFAPLEEDDAAIFFGRNAQIVRGLDKLRGLTRTGVQRMLIILGPSMCGKSSFLRAGLWPRLKRDDSTWLPLATIRPERAVISGKFGLVEALYRIMNEAPFAEKLQKQDIPHIRSEIEEFVTTREDGLVKILGALREAGHVSGLSDEGTQPPTIVIPIDQGEELFNEEGHAEAKCFIDVLTKTLAADPHLLALFTMRTDCFPQFQNDPVLATVPKDTFTLDMMLEGSYREIIEGPAALVKPKPLEIDPQLTEALLQDAAGQDALPLLAFTLRYLYEYQANNELSLEGYEKLGRLKGVIETTVKQALADGVSKGELPKDEKALLALIRKAFIPHMARVNAAGEFVSRIATRTEIPPEAQPLIDCLTEARLLFKDRRTVGGEDVEVIEVAHGALLREWKDLDAVLLEEREFLIAKGKLEQDAAEWRATPDKQKWEVLLRGSRLARARDWLIKRPQDLTADERQFIQASANRPWQLLRR